MKKRLIALLLSITLVTTLATGCGDKDKETEVTESMETVEDAEVEEATPTPEPTATPTPKPTKTPDPTATPTPTVAAEPTATPTPVVEAVPTEVVIVETPVPTATPTPEPTPVPAVTTRQVGKYEMYVWGYTTNGTPIYDVVGATNPGYPQYMIDALSDSGVTPEMSDYDKAVTLAKYLARRISYDYNTYDYSILESKQLPYTTYFALHNNRAICQGYANTYSQLMYMLGIECYYVDGAVPQGMHGWNRVVINNISYYNDITWNSCLGSDAYLMLDYNTMSRDHTPTSEYIVYSDRIW